MARCMEKKNYLRGCILIYMRDYSFRHLIIGVLLLSLCSCNKVGWVKTTNDVYIYGKFPKNKDIVWEGSQKGPLADGKGLVVIMNDEAQVVSRMEVDVSFGAISNYSYIAISRGKYLGKKKGNIPNGWGVLLNDDSLLIGTFKKGFLERGRVEIYCKKEGSYEPSYVGGFRKGLPKGYGRTYDDGQIIYEGGYKKGNKDGLGKEFVDGLIKYDGSFKKGLYHGSGREYSNGELVYEGEWKKGIRGGEGIEYNGQGRIVYTGSWKNGLYNGRGILFEKGQRIEGKWSDGRLDKSISSSVIGEIDQATKLWLSDLDNIEFEETHKKLEESEIPLSTNAFIEQLNDELEQYISENVEKRVEKRFGFWHLLRMIIQPWTKSDVKRANAAQKYFLKGIEAKEISNLINAKIDYYNEHNDGAKLKYVSINKIPDGAIVNTDVALNIFKREAIETTDVLVGILVDVILCFVVAFIIGFIIGFAIPSLLPYVGMVDAAMGVISFLIAIYLSVFRTSIISIQLEDVIHQAVVGNYMQYIDSQNIIFQILGLL